ncbi:MAG: TetR/AcrR family transcriptional regulator [Bacteroidetes bacterium]|nr:MAG: TetR/AcrR family transcriptional regulator [Bacteroidota bacterium]
MAQFEIINMRPTNLYIADHALRLFNKNGVVNVRLQHIADSAFVSVGHLAYHFKNKEALVKYLFEQHRQQQTGLLQDYRIMPLFADVNRMLQALYKLQVQYAFLYADSLELIRTYPGMADMFKTYTLWQHMQLVIMLSFQVSRGGLFLPHGVYTIEQLAYLLSGYIQGWRYRQAVLGSSHWDSATYFCNDVWQLLIPFCTPTGMDELKQLHLV